MGKERIKKMLSWTFVICFVTMLAVISVLSVLKKDVNKSFTENRSLTQFSMPNAETLFSGEWFVDFEKYCKDQIAGRKLWIETFYKLQDTLQVNERNGFILGEDSFVLPVNNLPSERERDNSYNYGERQVSAMLDIKSVTDRIGSTLMYVNIPSKADLFSEKYPSFYFDRAVQNDIERKSIVEKMKTAGIETVETYDLLSNCKDDYIYYATDHHFTIKGAYYVYEAILDRINDLKPAGEKMNFPAWNELDVQRNDSRMAGSYLRKWGDSQKISVDYVEYALPYDMPKFVRFDNGSKVKKPVLFSIHSSNYTSFMGGDIGNTIIDTGREELPSILYIGFSFTNALETLSVYNFNRMESLDPRHWEGNICQYIEEHKPDYVVIIRDEVYQDNPEFICTVR